MNKLAKQAIDRAMDAASKRWAFRGERNRLLATLQGVVRDQIKDAGQSDAVFQSLKKKLEARR